ncbi:alpha/beta fold hydrolase [Futiania mangrovi]|uniref:Alpha/beta hydrolase n=1 Tax=Futiania mangrovi TaxID=2959716 RepID=A0A9J6PNP2_9PROT|nr:alpha/beta hydrolase [Futiania mangrovii]MCP1337698.1 alpha/beta hydrolase [Futiania mangrovii]
MGWIRTDDGVALYCEDTGSGTPIVFVHEFAGDWRSWEPQVRALARRHRCITYSARGYHPSDIPEDASAYSQARARDDIRAVMDGLGIERAHIVGLSMGGFATLHFGIAYPERTLSLLVAGCGYGAEPGKRDQFAEEAERAAAQFEELGMEKAAAIYAEGPMRIQHQNKDPRGWAEFRDNLAEHSEKGSANTMRGVQKRRPSLYELVEQMKGITAPTLIVTGDEDWPCLEPGLLMKRTIPNSALAVLPNTGHTINLEEPERFNALLLDFVQTVDCGQWRPRDPRARDGAILTAR